MVIGALSILAVIADRRNMGKLMFIVADVHGFYDELIAALNDKGFDINNDEHIFVSLGDLFDRGPKPKECLEFAMDLYDKGRAILIYGNHEDLLLNIIRTGLVHGYDKTNGTVDSILSFVGNKEEEVFTAIKKLRDYELLNRYLRKATVFDYITNKSICCHAMTTEKTTNRLFDYLWANPIENWSYRCKHKNEDFPEADLYKGRTCYCGHFGSYIAHYGYNPDGTEKNMVESIEKLNFKEFYGDGIVFLDATTTASKFINCVVVPEEEF